MNPEYKLRGDLGKAWNHLLSSMYYKYKGYRVLNRSDGNVEVGYSVMTKEQFHIWVDELLKKMDESINRRRNKNKLI